MNSSQPMTPSALVLLAALLCAEIVQGLRCYQCQNCTCMTSCEQATCPFPEEDAVCVSQEGITTVGSETVRQENKLCLPVCPEKSNFNVTLGDITGNFRITCCKTDLCNSGVPVGGRAWILVGGLLFSLGLTCL